MRAKLAIAATNNNVITSTGDIEAFKAQFATVCAIVAKVPVPFAVVKPASAKASANVYFVPSAFVLFLKVSSKIPAYFIVIPVFSTTYSAVKLAKLPSLRKVS
jgi:hypothetical protein